MIGQPFDYFAPTSTSEVVRLLAKHRSRARLIAGGQSLIPLMNLGLASPTHVIDLSRIGQGGLSYIRNSRDILSIGAMTTHSAVERSPLVRRHLPLLHETVSTIADVQVRNRGTIGGAVCHADPAGDYLPSLVALDAEFLAVGTKGKVRRIAAVDFFSDLMTTALKPTEFLKEIRVPKQSLPHSGSAYVKHMYVEGGFAIVGVAAVVRVDRKGVCRNIRVALGGVSPVPVTLPALAETLAGVTADDRMIERAGQAAFDAVTRPLADIHADAEYRREMARVFTKRAVALAVKRALGKEA